MKYIIIILCAIAANANAQSKQPVVTMAEKTLSADEIKNINPALLDTIYTATADGNLTMQVEVSRGLDTVMVVDPASGESHAIIARKRNIIKPKTASSEPNTIYIKDPVTGELRKYSK